MAHDNDSLLTSNPHAVGHPAPWILRWMHLLPPHAKVLDVACGYGRHARMLAQAGHAVTAVDRDADALAALARVDTHTGNITAVAADLENAPWPFGSTRFDAVIVTHYLHRPLFPALLAAVKPDGVLLYETFAHGNAVFGKPSNPDFLLQPEELLEQVSTKLLVVAFEQGETRDPRPAVIERLCAVGRDRPWPPRLSELA